ncbi:hypothetical protein GCM10023339_41020 [Alloalcanivorax gelatiniphagus]
MELAGLVAGLLAWLLLGSAFPAAATSTATGTASSAAGSTAIGMAMAAASVSSGDNTRIDRKSGPATCSTLDSLCSSGPGRPHEVGTRPATRIDVIPDIDLNPLDDLGSVVAKAAADAWTAAMMAIWASGLFVLRIVLAFSEAFLTPDLAAGGPGREVYAFTLWMASALATVLVLVQLGVAAFKREGKGLARAVIGAAQFVLAYACWFGYCAVVVGACGALSEALMSSLLSVQTWPDFDPLRGVTTEDITDAATATVLAFLGVFLWLAAIGHILVYLARAASLLVLAATGPIAAAGLVGDMTRSWFWKSLRWFHAAAFTPVLMVLVLGIGVQFSNGVAASMSDGAQKAVATALPAVMLILVSVVAPMALFKLLAFVDPGTTSGASFRQGMAAVGGVQGLLSGGGSGGGGSSLSSAGRADGSGRSSGEQSAEDATGDRFAKSAQGLIATLGPVGQAAATGVGMVTKASGIAASLMTDQTNQAGVGQGTHGPDFSAMGSRGGGRSRDGSGGGPEPSDDTYPDRDGDRGSPPSPASPPVSPLPGNPVGTGTPAASTAPPARTLDPAAAGGSPGAPAPGGAAGGTTGGASGGAAGGAAAASSTGGAAAIPPVV